MTGPRERGTVTAELAIGSVVVVLALLLVLGVAVIGSARVRAQLAAGAGARAAARGETAGAVIAQAEALAGPGSTASITTDQLPDGGDGRLVRVVVERPVVLVLPGSPVVRVRASAAALREDDDAAPDPSAGYAVRVVPVVPVVPAASVARVTGGVP